MIDMVIDGSSLFARSWFASQKVAADDPILAVSFAIKTLLTILHPDFNRLSVRFDRMLFSWDSEHLIKKKREPKPPEYHETRRTLQETLTKLFAAAHCEHPDHEGDDIVATAVFQAAPETEIFIVSGDKDLQQLQSQRVHIYCLNTKAVLSRKFVCTKWRVKRPNQLAIALAIQGDSVDGITGIRGYGPKKVQKLFEQVPTTAKFAEALDIIESQIPEAKLKEFRAALNRTLLSDNVSDVPVPAEINMCDPVDVVPLEIPEILQRYKDVYRIYG